MSDARSAQGPLSGIKVVEFAQVIAGPLAGTLMADLGADVVHVESPGAGDTARQMGPTKDGHYLWWKVIGRNKRSVTLDLRQQAGLDLAHQLVAWADVLVHSDEAPAEVQRRVQAALAHQAVTQHRLRRR